MPDNPRATAAILGRPLHTMFTPFVTAGFIGALITDLAYVASANVQWSNFSIWLITAGLVAALFATITGAIDLFGDRRVRLIATARWYGVVTLSLYVVELFNAFVHSRDGWTAVVPTGLTLSIIGVVLLLVANWLGSGLVYHHRFGVRS